MIPTRNARGRAGLVVAGAVALVLVLVGVLILGRSADPPPATAAEEEGPSTGESDTDTAATVDVYFAGADDLLYPEMRDMPAGQSAEERVRAIAEAVLAGPESEHLLGSFSDDVELGGVDLDPDGTVYVDLRSEARRPAVTGSRLELVALYSLVNSVVYNVDEAQALVVLWNGRQRATFAGHIDTTRPVRPRPELIGDETLTTALPPSSAPARDQESP